VFPACRYMRGAGAGPATDIPPARLARLTAARWPAPISVLPTIVTSELPEHGLYWRRTMAGLDGGNEERTNRFYLLAGARTV